MLNPSQRQYLKNALVKAYIEEKEDKYESSTADGPLGIGCDPHACIMSMYIKPYLPNYDLYKKANEANPMTEADEQILMDAEEIAWDFMMEVEKEILAEMIAHLKKQFGV